MEKITLQELEGSYPSTSVPQSLRSRDSSGNLRSTPATTFVRADSNSLVRTFDFGYSNLVTLINRAQGWRRFSAFCILGSSDTLASAEVRIIGTYNSTNKIPIITIIKRGTIPSYIKFYYKVIDETLSVYIHCMSQANSPCPLLCISSHPITTSNTVDMSTYTEITPKTD